MKRILSLILALVLTVSCLSMAAFAVDSQFVDVQETDFFYEPVLWAFSEGITTGRTETEFRPGEACTRAQIVTFLWRSNGSPEPASTETAFTDVKADAYYYQAVLWAVEQGITTGKTATTFEPGATCTRAQAVTFMWRAKGEPAASNKANTFPDVKDSAYYFDAVLWAVENGITTGYKDGTFGPGKTCDRGQIVTFLYRGSKTADAPSDDGCPDCANKTTGLRFNDGEKYIVSNANNGVPATFEAVFTLPAGKQSVDMSLLNCDNAYDAYYQFAVSKTGNPKVVFQTESGFSVKISYVFDQVNVATGKPVRLTVVTDFANQALHCYVDGVWKQTIENISVKKNYVQKVEPAIGGDQRNGNGSFFRGTMDSLSLWTDIRTPEEIEAGVADRTDPELLAMYDLTQCEKCMREDLSERDNDLYYMDLWLEPDEVEPVGDFDYSFAVIGDTQTLNRKYPAHMGALYDWLLANQESQKIEYVLGLGDITDRSGDQEWVNADAYIRKLDGKIPYLLSRGNHDDWDDMNRWFHNGYYETTLDGMRIEGEISLADPDQPGINPDGRTEGNDYPEGGTVVGDITNAYQYYTAPDGTKYLLLALDFAPNAEMLSWASDVIEAHPDHRVIVITHAYMYRDGTTLDAGDCYPPTSDAYMEAYPDAVNGDEMWEMVFSQHENIVMVLSGHDPWQHVVYRQDSGVNGNTVTQMLIDPQYIDRDDEPTGLVAMFYFSNNSNTLTVRYYSVSKGCYGSALSQFTIDLR